MQEPRNKSSNKTVSKQTSSSKNHQPRNQAESNSTTDAKNRSHIAIIGDSMTKHINGSKLSREENVRSHSFSGAKIEDISDFIKPILRRKPKSVVIHVGTNNLRTDNPKNIKQKLGQLVEDIKKADHALSISFSSLIKRKDDNDLDTKVTQVNELLENFCRSNNLGFISNNNIGYNCLNRGGLHLNRKGVFTLASNLRNHLRRM